VAKYGNGRESVDLSEAARAIFGDELVDGETDT
jgi:hypothetical protein